MQIYQSSEVSMNKEKDANSAREAFAWKLAKLAIIPYEIASGS
jgi:hypothetical protein